jgi:hypothetical protein
MAWAVTYVLLNIDKITYYSIFTCRFWLYYLIKLQAKCHTVLILAKLKFSWQLSVWAANATASTQILFGDCGNVTYERTDKRDLPFAVTSFYVGRGKNA